mmetsp:Transcript_17180/g.30116  ORF Transcript_17180/g.30116 Transcript_17180/m.30116 type:complete len:139 (+) Transcript_17180:123-539(+)
MDARVGLPTGVMLLLLLITLLTIPVSGEVSESEDCKVILEQHRLEVCAKQAQEGDSMLMLASFMVIRAAIAMRSVYEGSPHIMWYGVVFTCFTRFVASGGDGPSDLTDVLGLATLGIRELLHVYGLKTVLSRFSPSCY